VTTVVHPNRLKPVLKLKLGGSLASAKPPAQLGSAPPPDPVPAPKPTPPAAIPVSARVTLSEVVVEPKPRPINATRAAAIAQEKIARRVAAYEAGKVEMKRRALEMKATLAERFPACFRPQGQPRLPLKVGIDHDIINLAPDLSETDVKQAIKSYVAAPDYYMVAIEGAVRVDLDGEPAGVVTHDQARWAQIKLGKRHHE
jgi:hypothetical protein